MENFPIPGISREIKYFFRVSGMKNDREFLNSV